MKIYLSLVSTMLLLFSTSAFSATCKSDMSYLLNEFVYSGIHQPTDIRVKVPRTGRASKASEGFFQAVYELEIDRLFPVPLNKLNSFSYDKIRVQTKESGFNLEEAIEVVIMPDNSLQILEGRHHVHILLSLGEQYVPARIAYWKYLPLAKRERLKDAMKSETELDFINRFDTDLKSIISKKEFGVEISNEEEVLYRAFQKEWKKHQQLLEILGHRDVQELHEMDNPALLEEIIEKVPRRNQVATNQALAPEVVRNSDVNPNMVVIENDGRITEEARRDFFQRIQEYREKNQVKPVQSEEKLLRAKQISLLNGNPILIATYERLERMKNSINFEDFKDYAADTYMQRAVKFAMKDFSQADKEAGEELFTNLLIHYKKILLTKEDFLTRIMDKTPEEQQKIISMTAVNKFAEFIKKAQ